MQARVSSRSATAAAEGEIARARQAGASRETAILAEARLLQDAQGALRERRAPATAAYAQRIRPCLYGAR
jgi:hypothetical protein